MISEVDIRVTCNWKPNEKQAFLIPVMEPNEKQAFLIPVMDTTQGKNNHAVDICRPENAFSGSSCGDFNCAQFDFQLVP